MSSRSTCEGRSRLTSSSTLSGARVGSGTASLRYDDGKTLKGMGTRASKSRLAVLWRLFSNAFRTDTNERLDKKRLFKG